MSTPVSIDTPPRPTIKKPEDEEHLMQARLQEMLDLQYEQQEREQEEMNLPEGAPHQPHRSSLLAPPPSETMDVTINNASERRMEDAAAMAGVGQGTLLFPKSYHEANTTTTASPSTATNTSSSNNINQSIRRTDVSLFAMHQQMILDSKNAANVAANQMQSLREGSHRALHYGSMQQQQPQLQQHTEELPYQQFTDRAPVVPPLPQGHFHPHYDSSSGPQIFFQLPHDGDASPSQLYASRYHRAHHPSHKCSSNCCRRLESCWTRFQESQQQQQPTCHRSFCYGAIDGLLTGSGIVAALVGMQILLPEQPPSIPNFWTTRWSIVVLCWAACGSDAICMALSHLWNGHMTLQSQGHARRQMQRFFVVDRNRAKAQLMDWLVQQQGLLKIDAMSLADTLEGYPDLFASVLMGDPLVSPIFQQNGSHQSPQQLPPPPHHYQQQDTQQPHIPTTQDEHHQRYSSGPRLGPPGPYSQHHNQQDDEEELHQHYRPYGIDSDRDEEIYGDCSNHGCCCSCCCCNDDGEQGGNPNSNSTNPSYLLWQESQWESWSMMWGFWMASGIPSLLFLLIPYLFLPTTPLSSTTSTTEASSTSTTASMDESTPSTAGGATSVASVVVTFTALIMWCLGVWKSHFHPANGMMGGGNVLGNSSSQSLFPDHKSSSSSAAGGGAMSSSSMNWMIFGMETVIILLVCIASAFTFGWILSQIFVFSNLHHHHLHTNVANHFNMTLQFHHA